MIVRRQYRLLAISGTIFVAASIIGPRIVPLYDGVGFPDEPYRYAGQSGKATLPPTDVNYTIPLTGQGLDTYSVTTGESGPQLAIYLPQNAVSAPPPATQVILSAVPLQPADQPKEGKIAGNVYRVTATSDVPKAQPFGVATPSPGPPTINNSQVDIALRLPQGSSTSPAPIIEYRQGANPWRPLVTTQPGNDIYEAHFAGLGDYAMVTGVINLALAPSTPGFRIWLVAGAIIVLVMILAIVAIRVVGIKEA